MAFDVYFIVCHGSTAFFCFLCFRMKDIVTFNPNWTLELSFPSIIVLFYKDFVLQKSGIIKIRQTGQKLRTNWTTKILQLERKKLLLRFSTEQKQV